MVDARIPCMTTAFDDTEAHPVTSTIAAVSQQLHDIGDLGLWTLRPAETDANLTALAPLRHQITELELRHAHQADRLDLGAKPAPPTPPPGGPTPPGRPSATPNGASSSRTPWTTTTSRSGTRWPPAACRRTRPR